MSPLCALVAYRSECGVKAKTPDLFTALFMRDPRRQAGTASPRRRSRCRIIAERACHTSSQLLVVKEHLRLLASITPPPRFPRLPDPIICRCESRRAARIKATGVKSSVGALAAAFNVAVFTENRLQVTFNMQIWRRWSLAEVKDVSLHMGKFLWKLIIHQRQSFPCWTKFLLILLIEQSRETVRGGRALFVNDIRISSFSPQQYSFLCTSKPVKTESSYLSSHCM